MPIFEYQCPVCKTKIEKITLKPVKETTVPPHVVEACRNHKCGGAIRRHIRVVSAPSYVGLTPPATSQQATRMREVRPARDKNWKARVRKGLNPEGKRLTNLKKLNRQEWNSTVEAAFPDLQEKRNEVIGRAQHGEFKGLVDALHKK